MPKFGAYLSADEESAARGLPLGRELASSWSPMRQAWDLEVGDWLRGPQGPLEILRFEPDGDGFVLEFRPVQGQRIPRVSFLRGPEYLVLSCHHFER